jgi:hypothetical protein
VGEPFQSSLMSFLDGNSEVRGLSTRDVGDAFRDATGEVLRSYRTPMALCPGSLVRSVFVRTAGIRAGAVMRLTQRCKLAGLVGELLHNLSHRRRLTNRARHAPWGGLGSREAIRVAAFLSAPATQAAYTLSVVDPPPP